MMKKSLQRGRNPEHGCDMEREESQQRAALSEAHMTNSQQPSDLQINSFSSLTARIVFCGGLWMFTPATAATPGSIKSPDAGQHPEWERLSQRAGKQAHQKINTTSVCKHKYLTRTIVQTEKDFFPLLWVNGLFFQHTKSQPTKLKMMSTEE